MNVCVNGKREQQCKVLWVVPETRKVHISTFNEKLWQFSYALILKITIYESKYVNMNTTSIDSIPLSIINPCSNSKPAADRCYIGVCPAVNVYKSKDWGVSHLILQCSSCSHVTHNQHRHIQMKFPLPVNTFPVCTIMPMKTLWPSGYTLYREVSECHCLGFFLLLLLYSHTCILHQKHSDLKKKSSFPTNYHISKSYM